MNNPNKIEQMKKVSSSPSISVLKIEGRFLVVGSSNGSVRFYDDQYRIEAWFEDIDLGSIHTISFSNVMEDGENELADSQASGDKLKDYKPFLCNDFIVVDDNARITMLKASLF
jgi:cilia- and flagella-associated protein 251